MSISVKSGIKSAIFLHGNVTTKPRARREKVGDGTDSYLLVEAIGSTLLPYLVISNPIMHLPGLKAKPGFQKPGSFLMNGDSALLSNCLMLSFGVRYGRFYVGSTKQICFLALTRAFLQYQYLEQNSTAKFSISVSYTHLYDHIPPYTANIATGLPELFSQTITNT